MPTDCSLKLLKRLHDCYSPVLPSLKTRAEASLQVLDRLGFVDATPVQEACIPPFLEHKDVAVDACTGSGKTMGFIIPAVEKLRKLDEQLKKNQVGI